MAARRIEHVSITVKDLERSVHFYCDLLGLEVAGEHRLTDEPISTMVGGSGIDMKVIRLKAPDDTELFFDLQQYLAPPGGVSNATFGDVAHSHVCFLVDDLDQSVEHLESQGARFVSRPVHFDLGEEGEVSVVFLYDPDGYVLELMQA